MANELRFYHLIEPDAVYKNLGWSVSMLNSLKRKRLFTVFNLKNRRSLGKSSQFECCVFNSEQVISQEDKIEFLLFNVDIGYQPLK